MTKLDATALRALSEVDGPLHAALERALLAGVPTKDLGWFRRVPTPSEPVHLVAGGRAVWSDQGGWVPEADRILAHAAGAK